jgi:hypothetical protein
MNHQSKLPPPQPRDPPCARPAVNWPLVTAQVMCIQRKLAGERAARAAEKEAQSK